MLQCGTMWRVLSLFLGQKIIVPLGHNSSKYGNWSKGNDITISFCNNFVWHYSLDTHIEKLWNIFKEFCMSCLSDIFFKIIGNISDHLWITSFIKCLTCRKQQAYNQTCLSHFTKNWSIYWTGLVWADKKWCM